MDYLLLPPEEIVETTVKLPLSKSESARRMIMDAVSGIDSPGAVAECDDIKVLASGLQADNGTTVDVGASGTALRFLTTYFAATPGKEMIIDGCPRLRERPLGILVDCLRQLGAEIKYLDRDGFAPVSVSGRRLTGGAVEMDASVSSQFVSALMMVAPTMESALEITLLNNIVSMPYIKMTAIMMERRGADVEIVGQKIIVRPGVYRLPGVEIEPDWSAASYWYSLAAISAGWVTLPGLSADSIQGDAAMRVCGERIGVNTDFDDEDAPDAAVLSASPEVFSRLTADMSPTPDLVPALAVAACALGIPFHFTGVSTLHDKECDRVEVLKREMLKIGSVLECEDNDTLSWNSRRIPVTERPVIDVSGDHRIAMAFAPVAVFVPGLVIKDIEVVDKSYPDFWKHLAAAGFVLREWNGEESAETEEDEQ
ncbi:MAG: 3-phosphoshikimate 1-carboxyvinyltransferase [Bacteroidales bacterium]|nr:3-phosphoshikimate 1-carboxyvinyltransferase [Bacteroidales bacterium]